MFVKIFLWTSRIIKSIWFILGAFLLALVILEIGSMILFSAWVHLHKQDPRMEYYQKLPGQMGPQILAESKKVYANGMWSPYVYWRLSPFKGRFININEEGLRRTANFPPSHEKPLKIFIFGASTLWGTDVPDEETIPSYLSKRLHERGIDARITNFGQIGYVSTQSLLALLLEVRKGNIPDLAIFYDGTNEVISTLENHIAGVTENEQNRVNEFNITGRVHKMKLLAYLIPDFLPSTVNVLGRLKNKIRPAPITPPLDPALADACVRTYAWNIRTAEALGREYGFKTIFYWAPTIFSKPHPTPYEQSATERLLKNKLPKESILSVYERINRYPPLLKDRRFHDLSGLFRQERRTTFTDPTHLSAFGNQLVAERILSDVISKRK